MVTLLVLSLIVLVIGAAIIFTNMRNAFNDIRQGNIDGIGKNVSRHMLGAFLAFVGGLGSLISGIVLIVRAFSN